MKFLSASTILKSILALIIFLPCTIIANAQTKTELGIKYKEAKEKVFNTPLKLTYTMQTLAFFREEDIIERMPDGKVKYTLPQNGGAQTRKLQQTELYSDYNYSEEFKMPFAKNETQIEMYVYQGKYYKIRTTKGTTSKLIEWCDGKDVKSIISYVNETNKEIKKGRVENPKDLRTAPDYNPLWIYTLTDETFSEKLGFAVEKTNDEIFTLKWAKGTKSATIILSAKEGLITLSEKLVDGDKTRREILQKNIIKTGDIYLSGEYEKRDFDEKTFLPKIFTIAHEIKYEIVPKEEVEAKVNSKFSEDVQMADEGKSSPAMK